MDVHHQSHRWCSAESVQRKVEPGRDLVGERGCSSGREKVMDASKVPEVLKQGSPSGLEKPQKLGQREG